ncbi:MAG: CDP-alcohol phosphatidyltransferase family protein, partial [Candidatus Thorarchaeota archaeon]
VSDLDQASPKSGLRKRYEAFFAPFGKLLANTRLSPNMISLLSLGTSIISCLAYSLGPIIGMTVGLLVGTLLLGLSSLLDMLDGSLARAKGVTGHFGALLDRTLDRISEFFFLLGIMLGEYVHFGLVFFGFEGMILASYVRAAAEERGSLKMTSTIGIFERKEKLTLLAMGCVLEAFFYQGMTWMPPSWWPFSFGILPVVIIVIGILSNLSAVQRLRYARTFYSSVEKSP